MSVHSSKTGKVPPTITSTSASRTCLLEPRMVASKKRMLRLSRRLARAVDIWGSAVVVSTMIAPGNAADKMPLSPATTSLTTWESGSDKAMRRALPATSAGDVQGVKPSPSWAFIFAGSMSYPAISNPLWRKRSISADPTSPSPMRPSMVPPLDNDENGVLALLNKPNNPILVNCEKQR